MKFDPTLYLVTDSTGRTDDDFLSILEKALTGGVTLVQLREKQRGGRAYLELAQKVKKITDAYDIPLIIDDRIDIALAADAAGVHVGQSDIPVEYARKLLGPDKIVGATAKTVEQARIAYAAGADYLGVGAMYPTTTKVVTVLTPPEMLNKIADAVPIPMIAIGGLNPDNLDIIKGRPVAGVAVVSAIMKAENPKEAARQLKQRVEQYIGKE